MAGNQYQSDDEVISAFGNVLDQPDESSTTNEILALQHWCKKCVDYKDVYVETDFI